MTSGMITPYAAASSSLVGREGGMNSRILAIAVDCHDAEAMAAFWRAALGYRHTNRWTGIAYVQLGVRTGSCVLPPR